MPIVPNSVYQFSDVLTAVAQVNFLLSFSFAVSEQGSNYTLVATPAASPTVSGLPAPTSYVISQGTPSIVVARPAGVPGLSGTLTLLWSSCQDTKLITFDGTMFGFSNSIQVTKAILGGG